MGKTARTREFVLAATESEKALVLDADALSAFEDNPRFLFDSLSGRAVLTPHEGEFVRLFPELSGSKITRAKAAAEKSKSCVVLKGSDSVIADPDGRVMVNNAPSNLATAGSGDVLSGLIAGLLAMGMEPFAAAAAACALHGLAAAQVGRGLIAEDLPDRLPAVFAVLDEQAAAAHP
jgi:NAD(P)H-hydrate epimerase